MYCVLWIMAFLATAEAGVVRMPRDSSHQYPACRPLSKCEEGNHSRKGAYYKVNGHELIIDFLDKSYFSLRCDSNSRDSSMFPDDSEMPAMLWSVTVEEVKIEQCLIPRGSYYATLKAFNVTVTRKLKLKLSDDFKLEMHHLRGLQITHLEIAAIDSEQPLRPSFDFLDEIPGLKTLALSDVVPEHEALRRLPTSLENLNIVNARLPTAERMLRNGSDNALHWLEKLNLLQNVLLADSSKIVAESSGEVFTLPQLSFLPNLISMSLHYMPFSPERLTDWLKDSVKLKNLTLKSCGLTRLPRTMFDGAQLTNIILAYNNLTSLPEGLFTPLKDSLLELDLSYNNLNKVALVDSVKKLKNLKILKASHNPLGSLCQDSSIIKTRSSSDLPASLHKLELKNTRATRICNDWIRNHALMDIDLSYNAISTLTYSDLEMNRTMRDTVQLNLTKNTLRRINVSRKDFLKCLNQAASPIPHDPSVITRVPVQLQLKLNSLACDCDAYWLREVLRNCSLLQLQGDVSCLPNPTPLHATLLKYQPDEISCPYNGFCLPECTCEKRPRDNATVVRCPSALPRDPTWPLATRDFPVALHVAPGTLTAVPNTTLVELYAPNNNITKLDEVDVPDTLRVLDVRNNNISHISLTTAQLLERQHQSNQNLSVYLSGNILDCECDDASAFGFLKLVVRDWNSVKCKDMSLVSRKTKNDLCPSSLLTVIVIVVILLAFIVSGLAVFRLLPRVKQFLFRHHWFVDWIFRDSDDIDDQDIEYDVFLSYSHADLKQLKKLKYGLKRLGYITLEHQNDWHPGDAILEQITRSVISSRRTLLLVSDNFAKSEWTPVEFEIAHRHALKTRSRRILIVRCGLEKPEKLPLDLQVYLEKHTYLDWDAPKFWDKLSRFMPKPRDDSVKPRPDDLDPPSPLLQLNSPLLEKSHLKPKLAIEQLSVTGPSAGKG